MAWKPGRRTSRGRALLSGTAPHALPECVLKGSIGEVRGPEAVDMLQA